MGIPGLSSALQQYAILAVIGCKTRDCKQHVSKQVIIDGPAFVYEIYYRLTANNPGSPASYNEIGEGSLKILDELKTYGVEISAIYFDGYLPVSKRETRIRRLEQDLNKLVLYRKKNPDGFYPLGDGGQSHPSHVLQPGGQKAAASRDSAVATFVVPAVIESIRNSAYAKILRVVPGEAENYGAQAARETGGIILSNDSDLFVHNLGSNGAFAFLSQLIPRIANCQSYFKTLSKPCETLECSLFTAPTIADRLHLPSLQRLAYNMLNALTFSEALDKARHLDRNDCDGFQRFLVDYNTDPSDFESHHFVPELLVKANQHIQILDPRISEFVLQLASKTRDTPFTYLLMLHDDPSRSFSWLVSASQRCLAYSVSMNLCPRYPKDPRKAVMEWSRRGQRIIAQEVSLLNEDKIFDHTAELQADIQNFQVIFATKRNRNPDKLDWRAYALLVVYRWHLDNDKTPPSQESIRRTITGDPNARASWDDVHLWAQLEAVLYSLRILHQLLKYTIAMLSESGSTELGALAGCLSHLPPLAQLLPSRQELAEQTNGPDTEYLLQTLAGILQNEYPQEDDERLQKSGVDGGVDRPERPDKASEQSVLKSKKKRRKRAG